MNPDGKALIRPAPYVPPKGWPDEGHPFHLTTGRTLYHFHTRTKTGRVPQLEAAAPDVWGRSRPPTLPASHWQKATSWSSPPGAVRCAGACA